MNFIETILGQLGQRGELTALTQIHGASQKPSTAAEVADLVASARGTLLEHGLKPGQRVALLAPNSTRWAAADLAILAQGGIVVPLYARQDPHELAVMTRDCEPSLLIAGSQELADAIKSAWPEACEIILLRDLFDGDAILDSPVALGPEDPVTIIYTSGTSGVPKGVILTCQNVDFMIPQTAASVHAITGARGAPDRVFHFLPFCFAGSRIMLWTQLYRGNPLMMSTDLTNLVEEMATSNPHYYLNVPAVLERIRNGVGHKIRTRGGLIAKVYNAGVAAGLRLQAGTGSPLDRFVAGVAGRLIFPRIKQQIGSNLEFLICGSAPLSPETQRWFELIGITVYQVYGLTETTAIVTMDKPGKVEAGRVGIVLDGCEAKLGEGDELLIKGPNVFAGYWNKDDVYAETVVDGWLHTGDQADIDNAGNWRIVGRVKNILVPESGHNVPPEPIEQTFMAHCPEAEQCMLIGHGRPFLSMIVTGEVSQAAVQAAIERANSTLPHYRKIRKFHCSPELFTIENGLLTANQKLRRKVIEAHFKPALEGLYTP